MAIELVLDASVSLAWFLKETPDRAAYAAAVSGVAGYRSIAAHRARYPFRSLEGHARLVL
jgi:hypothetical protein